MSLSALVEQANVGINRIKLKDLLIARKACSSNQAIRSLYPPVEIGSITLVDQIVLLSLIEITQPKRIIEIGTYLGYTSSLFALNTTQADIFTIDLPKEEATAGVFDQTKILSSDKDNDNYLRHQQQFTGEVYLKELSQAELKRVHLIKENSTAIDFLSFFKQADFIFIDGGHENDIVRADTVNARSIIERGVIVWHDFNSSIHTDVTDYLSKETERKIFYVEGSLCAFEIIGSGF